MSNKKDKIEPKKTTELIETVENIKKNDMFSKYITEIYFPSYKNFIEFSKIHFDFPLTVLVGKNGSGKSSVLHALYGCPKNSNTGDFWFSTATDPIKETNGKANCFVYSYYEKKDKNIEKRQVVYTRASRPGTKTKRKNPDYWETAKHSKKYRTNIKRRCPPIDEKLIYLDFRQELSAYDRYFYFGKLTKANKAKTKQDFIREASPKINNIFRKGKSIKGNEIYKAGGVAQNEKVILINDEELHYISYILGVNYAKIQMVNHKFFKIWGTSALVTKNDISYSEANAGSGEYAVINLVHKLCSIPKESPALVILDEPETSLYPGAQKRLLDFLLEMIVLKKCQIIISTHSEKLTKSLPRTAIKKIHYDQKTGKSNIQENCSPLEVFEELDLPVEENSIIVEDRSAEILINKIIENEKLNNLKAKHLSEGANQLKQTSIFTSAMQDNKKQFFILDGDQKIEKEKLDLGKMSGRDANNPKIIQKIVDSLCPNIPFPSSKQRRSDKSKNQNKFDKIKFEKQKKYINFYRSNVYFLPKKDPETIIYDEKYIDDIVGMLPDGDKNINKRDPNLKDLYHQISIQELGESRPNRDEYYAIIKMITNNFVKRHSNSCSYKEIVSILKEISQKCQNNN